MRLPKSIRRLKRQRSEAERLRTHHQRESKLRPIRAELERAGWEDGAIREIHELYRVKGRS